MSEEIISIIKNKNKNYTHTISLLPPFLLLLSAILLFVCAFLHVVPVAVVIIIIATSILIFRFL